MANVYTPPGVQINELTQPSVAPILGSPADICIIGVAGLPSSSVTPITTTDVMILTGTSPQVLPTIANLNSDAQLIAVLQVTDVLDPSVGTPLGSGYVVTLDYTVTIGVGPPDGPTGQATIARVGSGDIQDGTLVAVTYTYLPSDYWSPIRLFDIGSVEARFGDSWSIATGPNGQAIFSGINSQLSMAARLAFLNGAPSVVCQPLFARATPGNPTTAQVAPSAGQVGNSATWSDTLDGLRAFTDIDIIVPAVGQDGTNINDSSMISIFSAVQSHIAYQAAQEINIVGIFGEDGTPSAAAAAGLITTIRTHAGNLRGNFGNTLSSQMVLINNTVFLLPTPGGQSTQISVGGQYCAAAVAGAIGSRPVSSALTRQPILGFLSVTDPRTPADKNTDASVGLMVIERVSRTNLIRCRQGITLDIANGPPKQELSVVRSKFLMIDSIKQTLEDQIIGQIIADANSPMVVASAIGGVLALLQQSGAIVAYSTVDAVLTSLTPTTITATFAYQPAFPLNFIVVNFSIDLTNSSVTVSSGGTS